MRQSDQQMNNWNKLLNEFFGPSDPKVIPVHGAGMHQMPVDVIFQTKKAIERGQYKKSISKKRIVEVGNDLIKILADLSPSDSDKVKYIFDDLNSIIEKYKG